MYKSGLFLLALPTFSSAIAMGADYNLLTGGKPGSTEVNPYVNNTTLDNAVPSTAVPMRAAARSI